MKRDLILVLAVWLCCALVGCGGGEKSYQVSGGERASTGGDGSAAGTDTFTVRYSDKPQQSVALPADYPEAGFPVYPGSFIAAAQDYEESCIVTGFAKEPRAQVTAFYREALQDAQVISVTDDDQSYVSYGVKDDYIYTVTVVDSTEFKGYPTCYTISLVPAEKGMAEALSQLTGPGGGSQ